MCSPLGKRVNLIFFSLTWGLSFKVGMDLLRPAPAIFLAHPSGSRKVDQDPEVRRDINSAVVTNTVPFQTWFHLSSPFPNCFPFFIFPAPFCPCPIPSNPLCCHTGFKGHNGSAATAAHGGSPALSNCGLQPLCLHCNVPYATRILIPVA